MTYTLLDKRFTVDQFLTGDNRGKFVTRFDGMIIKYSDTMDEAINYAHEYQKLRMSAFNIPQNWELLEEAY